MKKNIDSTHTCRDGAYSNGYYSHPQTDFYFDLDFDARLGPAEKQTPQKFQSLETFF